MEGTEKENLLCGIHGGLGEGTLTDSDMAWNDFPRNMRQIYCESIDRVIDMPVDIVLPSHAGHGVAYDFYQLAAQNDGSGRCFVDTGAWKRMLAVRKNIVLALSNEFLISILQRRPI